jgi:hypothetical protein
MTIFRRVRDFARSRLLRKDLPFRSRFTIYLLYLGLPYYLISILFKGGRPLDRFAQPVIETLGFVLIYSLLESGVIRIASVLRGRRRER